MGSTVSCEDDRADGRRGTEALLDVPDMSQADTAETTQLIRHRDMHMTEYPPSGHKCLSLTTWVYHTNAIIHGVPAARRMREKGKTTEHILLVDRTVRRLVAVWIKTQCCACEGL